MWFYWSSFPGLIAVTGKVITEEVTPGDSTKTVAVIDLKGEIMDSKEIVSEIYRQSQNDKVKGIVLKIDSPGGAVSPSQDIYQAVKELKAKKPIVVSMGSLAASGGLYSALAASRIFCQPGTLTGSIGVIMQVPNFAKLKEKVGADMITFKSGALKDVGNPFREMNDADRDLLSSLVNGIYADFVKAVSESRNIPIEKVKSFADGRPLTGQQALDLKLVDGFGDVYTAAREVFAIRNEPLKDGEVPTLFYPSDKFAPFKDLIKSVTSLTGMASTSISLKMIM